MRRSSHAGFALITVLVFLEIFAVLTLYGLRGAEWQIRSTRLRFEKSQLSQAAHTILANGEFLAENKPCNLPLTPAWQLYFTPLTWWETHSCAGNFNLFQYYYVVETLGDDPCARVDNMHAAHYIRVTLLTVLKADHSIRMFLQSSVVTASESPQPCDGATHRVIVGTQSLREITA